MLNTLIPCHAHQVDKLIGSTIYFMVTCFSLRGGSSFELQEFPQSLQTAISDAGKFKEKVYLPGLSMCSLLAMGNSPNWINTEASLAGAASA